MRITRSKLLDLALRETEQQADDGDVISGYVVGSLAAGDPLIGGTCDVDLVLIHEHQPIIARQIVPLSSEVHLDIHHHPKQLYAQPVELRHHPWHGPAMCEPAFLYDPTHFFEWAQAAVRGQYHRPDHVHARAQAFLRRARRTIERSQNSQRWLAGFLAAVLETVNAVACLAGFPPAGRRLAAQLQQRLAAAGHPGLFDRFQVLLGANRISKPVYADWTAQWTRAFDAVHQNHSAVDPESAAADHSLPEAAQPSDRVSRRIADPEIAPDRRLYFLAAFQSMVERGQGSDILWPMLMSWERIMRTSHLHQEHRRHWSDVLEILRLSPANQDRLRSELERLQDDVELVLESWAERAGA